MAGHPNSKHVRKEDDTVEGTHEFVENLQENREKAEHNRKHAKGNPGKNLPNKRKGTMK